MGAASRSEPASTRPTLPVVFGVLGGIASGKSAVARLLAGETGVVISADEYAREALDSATVQERLLATFGPRAVGADGRADREFLARRVFSDPRERELLEGWIHPVVRERISVALAEARRQAAPRVVLDVPLLLENDAEHGLLAQCDHLVFVAAPQTERDRRAVAHREWATGEVARREATQMPLDEKRRRADFVVRNDGSLSETAREVDRILSDLQLT